MRRLWHALLAPIVLLLLALAGLWTAGRLAGGYTLDLGGAEWGRIQNANDWEEHGSYTYRWTRDATALRLPHIGAPRIVTIRLDGTRPAGIPPAEVTLSLDGQDLATFLPPAGPALYQVVYDVPDAWRWETVVGVRTAPFTPPGDPRTLGVIVDRLHFSAPLAPPAPPWLLVILWAAVGLAASALAHLLEWPVSWRAILPVALVVALIALYGPARQAALPWAGLLLAVFGLGAVVAGFCRARHGEDDAPERAGEGGALVMGPFVIACLVLAVGVALFPLLAPLLGGAKSWGLKMLEPFYPQTGFLPRAVQRLLPLAVVALVAVPAVSRDTALLGEWLWRGWRRATWRLRPAGRALLLGLLFVPLGYLLRARILWGDGPSLIGRIGAGYRFNEPEMLPFLVHTTLYQWAERLWGWSVPDVYVVTGLFLGALYVALAAALGDTLGRTRPEKGLVFGLLITLGTIEFGFGYLENYAFVTVALLALFWQMARCLQGRGSPAVVAALWVVAGVCHLQALLVGPAVVYTLVRALREPGNSRRVWRTLLAGLLTAALLLGLFLAAGYDLGHLFRGAWTRGNNPYMLVPLRSAETYTLFSLTHLLNVVNEHLLVAPVVLPLLGLVAAFHWRRMPWRDPLAVALALGAAGLVLFASTLYPDLSAAMDWDLFAPAALPYTLLAGYLFARAVPEGRGKEYAALVLLFSAGTHAALWVLLNARLL